MSEAKPSHDSASMACVFCARRGQPATLCETASLYAMPDKYPLVPGHVLIIPKRHVRCYAAASSGVLRELDEVAARVRHFLADMYGGPVLINETGVAGQTVPHAHLHLTPMPNLSFPPETFLHDDVTPVDDWRAVRDYYARRGRYYYVEFGDKKYCVTSYDSPVIWAARRAVAEAAGLSVSERGLVRATTPDDVRVVERRWRAWAGEDR